MTESGAVLGTPGYLAPEQAASAKALTTAADVYGLGAILYELLTGRPPFRGETDLETLRQVSEEEPVRPRALQPRIDRDLEAVCLKCLEKDPSRRYPSAEALAEDLERWQRGEPVRARRIGPVSRLLKWVRRRRAVATLLGLCVLLAAAGLAAGRRQWQQGAAVRTQLDEQLYAEALAVVERSLAENNEKQAEVALHACPRSARGWEWHCLKRLLREPPQAGTGSPIPPFPTIQRGELFLFSDDKDSSDGKYSASLAWETKNSRYASGWRFASLTVSDRITGKKALALQSDTLGASTVGLVGSPQGQGPFLAASALFPGRFERFIAAAFSPDGQRFAALSSTPSINDYYWYELIRKKPPEPSNRVKVWDIESGKELFSIVSEEWHPFHDFAFTPDSQRIITIGLGGGRASVRVWDARNGRGLVTIGSWAPASPPDALFGGSWVSEPQSRHAKLTFSPAGDHLTLQLNKITPIRGKLPWQGVSESSVKVWDVTPVRE